jgi:hypothetical protein
VLFTIPTIHRHSHEEIFRREIAKVGVLQKVHVGIKM